MLDDLLMGARLLIRLPGLLHNPIELEQAERILEHRFRTRAPAFLTLARRAIYDRPDSPYRRLLQMAGCEYGDLERLVTREGVEGALRVLCRQGVYLTVDEFKGRRPILRGNTLIEVKHDAFWNSASAVHALLQTSGGRGARTPVPLDLAFIRDGAVNFLLVLRARGGMEWRHAIWWVPGGTALSRLLALGTIGISPARWFSQLDLTSAGLHPRYRWSARAARWGSLFAGVPFPRCEYVPLSGPLPIARWMAEVLRAGSVPSLSTTPGAAVCLVQAAREARIDLIGAKITLGGEPVTAARLDAIRGAGAQVFHGYGSMETGGIAWGCLQPEAPDDSHLHHDRHALIQPGADMAGPGLPQRTLLLSSLRLTAPVILLNVSLGDEAFVFQRACGCPLERLGWTTHIHTIRSFEKLTAAGMKLLDTDVIRVLEEVLPTRFGGGPTHYQLIEEEGEGGEPQLRLLVHPDVGPIDARAVAQVFLAAIGPGAGPEHMTGLLWSKNGLLRVERRPPVSTESGKILHIHSHHPGQGGHSPTHGGV